MPNVLTTDTLSRQTDKAHAYLQRALMAVRRTSLTPARQRKLDALMGTAGCTPELLLSDVTARIKAAELLFDVTRRLLPKLKRDGEPMFHITFADDIGLSSDRKPTLRFKALKRKIYKAIRAMGLSGIVMVEVQPLTNHTLDGRKGRTLMLNGHGLCWGPVSRRTFRAAKKKLNESSSWSNSFGAKPIVSRQLKGGLDDALRIICYIAKLPHDAKYLVPVQSRSGSRFRFKPTLTGYPGTLALRILEGLSHHLIFDAVFGVGDGKFIRKEWKRDLVDWHRERMAAPSTRVRRFDVAKFWQRVRQAHGDGRYQPYAAE